MNDKKLNIKTAKKLIFICFSMFLFSFALIPIYNVICDVTGLNGNTSNLKEKVEQYSENISAEKLNIQFSIIILRDYKITFDKVLLQTIKSFNVIPNNIIDDRSKIVFAEFKNITTLGRWIYVRVSQDPIRTPCFRKRRVLNKMDRILEF